MARTWAATLALDRRRRTPIGSPRAITGLLTPAGDHRRPMTASSPRPTTRPCWRAVALVVARGRAWSPGCGLGAGATPWPARPRHRRARRHRARCPVGLVHPAPDAWTALDALVPRCTGRPAWRSRVRSRWWSCSTAATARPPTPSRTTAGTRRPTRPGLRDGLPRRREPRLERAAAAAAASPAATTSTTWPSSPRWSTPSSRRAPDRPDAGLRHRHLQRRPHGLPPGLRHRRASPPSAPTRPPCMGACDHPGAGVGHPHPRRCPTTASPSPVARAPASPAWSTARRCRRWWPCGVRSTAARRPTSTTAGVVTTSVATCPDGRAVELITITGAGHQWPGGKPPGSRRPGHRPGPARPRALDATAHHLGLLRRPTPRPDRRAGSQPGGVAGGVADPRRAMARRRPRAAAGACTSANLALQVLDGRVVDVVAGDASPGCRARRPGPSGRRRRSPRSAPASRSWA